MERAECHEVLAVRISSLIHVIISAVVGMTVMIHLARWLILVLSPKWPSNELLGKESRVCDVLTLSDQVSSACSICRIRKLITLEFSHACLEVALASS